MPCLDSVHMIQISNHYKYISEYMLLTLSHNAVEFTFTVAVVLTIKWAPFCTLHYVPNILETTNYILYCTKNSQKN